MRRLAIARVLVLSVFLIFFRQCSEAQLLYGNPSSEHGPATLGVRDTTLIPDSLLGHSTFTYYREIDSFSKIGDSINSGKCLLQVDPYFVLRYGITPEALDTFFNGYLLTAAAKDEYRLKYTQMYKQPRAVAYKRFQAMFEEDQQVRSRLDNCGDSVDCEKLREEQMQKTDSVHFTYLYNYVRKNGWPSLEKGSMYAQGLVIHDHSRYDYYLPILRNAVLSGIFPASLYRIIWHYRFDVNVSAQELLNPARKVVIDVSCLLKNNIDDSVIQKINSAIQSICPIKKVIYVYESNKLEDANSFYLSLFNESADIRRGSYFRQKSNSEYFALATVTASGLKDTRAFNPDSNFWKSIDLMVFPYGCCPTDYGYDGITFAFHRTERKRKKLLLMLEY